MSPSISRTTATTATARARPDFADTSVGELISDVTRDLSTLIRQEFELATAELRQELIQSGKAAGTLGEAAFAGQMMLQFASCAVVDGGQGDRLAVGGAGRGCVVGAGHCGAVFDRS